MPQMTDVAFTLHNLLTKWQWSSFPLAVLIVLGALLFCYLRQTWILALHGREWSKWRTASFVGGLVAIDLALQSPIATFTSSYFQAHVLQHLLLMVVAPPLLALSAPSTLLLQSSSRKTKTRWLAILRSTSFATISHPMSAFFLYFGFMSIFFLTQLINFAMLHMWLMDTINVVFLFGGTLYWWPMIGIDPIVHWKMEYGSRMLNILLGTAVEAFLGVSIIAYSRPIASMYTVNGTRAGGALLWVSTEFVTLGAFIPIYIQWTRSEARVGARADKALRTRHLLNNAQELSAEGGERKERSLTAWELEWIARTGSAPQELRLADRHLNAPRTDA